MRKTEICQRAGEHMGIGRCGMHRLPCGSSHGPAVATKAAEDTSAAVAIEFMVTINCEMGLCSYVWTPSVSVAGTPLSSHGRSCNSTS